MLEEMAEVVYANDRHEHVLRRLLDEVNATMSIYHVWGSHLGSAHLFRQHLDSRRRITEIVEKTQVRKAAADYVMLQGFAITVTSFRVTMGYTDSFCGPHSYSVLS